MTNSRENKMDKTAQAFESEDELLARLGRAMAPDPERFQNMLLARLNQERIRPSRELDTRRIGWFSVTTPSVAYASVALVAMISIAVLLSSQYATKPVANVVASIGETNLADVLQPGETIQTMNDGQASLLLTDHSLLRFDNDTSAIIEGRRQVKLTNGRLYAEVARSSQAERFQITAQDVQIIVLGTAFEVETNQDGTSVKVTDGTVRVSWASHEEILNAGDSITISKGNMVPSKTTVKKVAPDWIENLAKAEQLNPVIQAMQKHFPSRSMNLKSTP
ncbi:MAG: FecR domain-containing protein [Candidatus Hinthialibacter antarcticus]|nr:FecR domain-containing protein [Candidatus Hinthialibacter antarcticus]